ncbi:phosphotransferase family protein [Streptomyces sp. BV129]|uniref:phosphotransferase family protein n=1 Tax=Streptomyces sp. BV129 TaxID=2849671 RepID=UPI001C2EE405|nr:phosphotransferase family protein [Streptomyces sp. BV129]MBV1949042.1 phosphotransferase family protein [Streptomyces sp. BV129]
MSKAFEPSGVDFRAVAEWMDGQGLGSGPVQRVEPISGGTQNMLLRFERAGRPYVLRRGPRHLRAQSNDSLRREMRVLRALTTTAVPHPRLIAACPDETVLGGAVFYLMEPVEGFNVTVALPPAYASAPFRHRMGLAAADALAALGSLDHRAIGLEDFGRPDGFLERQVPRWLAELDSYGRLPGYPGPDLPGVRRTADWLERNRPATWTPGLMHGDYHLANALFAYDRPEVAAIVDWEMCTVGDPLLDLGWMLATWPQPDTADGSVPDLHDLPDGLPSAQELVARYTENSSRDLSALTWYTVLARFKLGIVLEGTHARAMAGQAPKDLGDRLHAVALGLFSRARHDIATA